MGPLRGLGVGFAGTYGRQKGIDAEHRSCRSYRTDGQQIFFSYVTDNPATAPAPPSPTAPQSRISPQGYWYWGPVGFLWEWAQSNNDVSSGRQHRTPSRRLPGRPRSPGSSPARTTPTAAPRRRGTSIPWTFLDGAWGALEVAARYPQLQCRELGLHARLRRSERVGARGEGVGDRRNWYLNPMVRLMLDFDHTTFTGGATNGGDRPSEDVIMSRVQFVF